MNRASGSDRGKAVRAQRSEDDAVCPRCRRRSNGRSDRLLDPYGNWFICTRCGLLVGDERKNA